MSLFYDEWEVLGIKNFKVILQNVEEMHWGLLSWI